MGQMPPGHGGRMPQHWPPQGMPPGVAPAAARGGMPPGMMQPMGGGWQQPPLRPAFAPNNMQGGGRGRNMTQPAWMKGGAPAGAPPVGGGSRWGNAS